MFEVAGVHTIQARYASTVLILLDEFAFTSSVSKLMLSWLTLMLLALTVGSPKQYATVPFMTGAVGFRVFLNPGLGALDLPAAAGVVGTIIKALQLAQQHSQK